MATTPSQPAPPNLIPGDSRSRSSSIPSSTSISSDIHVLLQESVSSLDEAVSRPFEPIKNVTTSSTGQQLLSAVLDTNRRLEKERLEMRREIEVLKLENEELRKELEKMGKVKDSDATGRVWHESYEGNGVEKPVAEAKD
jgi:predicted component of type VI protein secretion system